MLIIPSMSYRRLLRVYHRAQRRSDRLFYRTRDAAAANGGRRSARLDAMREEAIRRFVRIEKEMMPHWTLPDRHPDGHPRYGTKLWMDTIRPKLHNPAH